MWELGVQSWLAKARGLGLTLDMYSMCRIGACNACRLEIEGDNERALVGLRYMVFKACF